MTLIFTKHAEEQARSLKGTPDVDQFIKLLTVLENNPQKLQIHNVTEGLMGMIHPNLRKVELGQWRVLFTEDKSAKNLIIISVQKAGSNVDFDDVLDSVVSEVSSTAVSTVIETDEALGVVPKKTKER